MIIGGATLDSGIDTGDIPASLRFRSGASAYLSRTFGAPTDNKKWTWSGWVKRGALPAAAYNLLSGGSGGSNDASLMLDGNGSLWLYYWTGSYVFSLTAAAFSRDPTSHVHLVVSYDSTQAQTGHSASDSRVRFYLNGVQVSSTGTLPSQNYASNQINAAVGHRLGYSVASSYPFDGYLSRIAFVDGQALTPSSFGYFNTEINEWVSKSQSAVKAVVDAGGTNSFMLDFDDPNFATYNVGKDYSSKGNHWTPNNFSLTAGTSYDRMLDVPGNSFATLNPLDTGGTAPVDGSLTYTNGATEKSLRGSMALPLSGKWYAECTVLTTTNASSVTASFGVANRSCSLTTNSYILANAWNIYSSNAAFINRNGTASASLGFTVTAGDTLQIAYDADSGKLWLGRSNVWFNSTAGTDGNPATGTNATVSGLSGDLFAFINVYGNTHYSNFGQAPLHASATYDSASGGYFRYTPPSGYKALCQRNMPDPAILNPEKHFDVRLHVGNAASQKVTSDFKPGLVWIKRRNISATHSLFDEIRGASVSLHSETTGANDSGTSLNSLDADGFTLGNNANTNSSPDTFVDWLWKAGGAAVTNNAGTVSAQVSANVNAGFSIATFASPAAGDFSIGHGLPKAPGLVIAKATNGNTFNWAVFHVGVCTNGQFLRLNTTDAKQTPGGNVWGAAIPSATLVNLTATGAVEASKNCVVYSFAEIPGFSKIFSYTGNGSADGPFVHCGFKPKFILYKRSDNAANWVIWDAIRSPENVVNDYLLPNSSGAEATLDTLDIVSNGFKLRTTNADNNGGTVVGIAFADVPAKYALAR